MNQQNSKNKTTNRLNIIESVKTPIGFFVFAVLVIEAIFGVVLNKSEGSERAILIISMIALISTLVAIVVVLAVFRPEALKGERQELHHSDEDKTKEIEQKVSELMEVIRSLSKAQQVMSEELSKYHSVRANMLDLFAQDEIFALDDIYTNLISGSTHIYFGRSEVQSVIGVLIEEGKIEEVPRRANYYRGVRGENDSDVIKV